jgi:transposase
MAAYSRLALFQALARMLRTHLEGVLAWTLIRVTNDALEGMNNKIKVISYRTFWTFIANIYHYCTGFSLP